MTAVTLADTPLAPPKPLPMPPWKPGGPSPFKQQATCPTCGVSVPGLLAACWKPACLTADLDYDAAFERYDNQ